MESIALGLMAVSTLGLVATLYYARQNPDAYKPFGHRHITPVKDGQNPAAMKPEMAAHADAAQKKLDAMAGTRKVDKAS